MVILKTTSMPTWYSYILCGNVMGNTQMNTYLYIYPHYSCNMENAPWIFIQVLIYPNLRRVDFVHRRTFFRYALPVFANEVIQRSTIISDATKPRKFPSRTMLTETNSKRPRKLMVWKLLSFWVSAYFQGQAVSFRESNIAHGTCNQWNNHRLHFWFPGTLHFLRM